MMRISLFAFRGANGIVLYKIIFRDKKECWKWNLWCTPVKIHNMDADQLVFGTKKEPNSSISDYFMLYSMLHEKDSDESFTVLCQSWMVRYFDGNCIKISLLEDLFRKVIV